MEITDAWAKRLIEIARLVGTTEGQERNGWINYLLGYIESIK